MHTPKSTVAAVVVALGLTVGLVGTTPAAQARPAPASASQRGVLDLLPLDLPLLSGLGEVGQLLQVTPPTWNLPGVENQIVWLRDGVPIPGTEGLWSYLPTDADAGHEIAAQVTGVLAGLVPITLITNALGIPLPGEEAETPKATVAPRIDGSPKVGTQLTALPPTWDVAVQGNSYQWLRNGQPIPGATTTHYVVSPDDVIASIAVKVTGTTSAGRQGVATSAGVLGLPGDPLQATTPASVTGSPRAGSVLTAHPGSWGSAPATELKFEYAWLRGGRAISGATDSTYVVKRADVGKRLAVKVTAIRTGYQPGTSTSAPVTVAKLATTTRVALPKKAVGARAAALLRITLRAAGSPFAGRVRVLDGSRPLGAYTVRRADNGSRVVRLPRLKPGRHHLRAKYAGSATARPSTSRTVTLTVHPH